MSYAINGVVNVSGGDYSGSGGNTVDSLSYGSITLGSANTVTNSPYSTVLSNYGTITDSVLSSIVGGQGKTITASSGNIIISSNDDAFTVNNADNQGIHLYTTGYTNLYGGLISPLDQAPANAYAMGVYSSAGPPAAVMDPNGRVYDEGAMLFDSTNKDLYQFRSGGWIELSTTIDTLAQTLAAGNSTGANDIVISSAQQIQFANGIRIGGNNVAAGAAVSGSITIGKGADGPAVNAVGIGANVIISSLAQGAVALGQGISVFPAALYGVALGDSVNVSGLRGVALGSNAQSNHTNAVAIGTSTVTDAANQIKFGANNTYYAETPGYFKSGLQKAAAVGVDPTVPDPTQTILTGSGLTTIIVRRTFFDWAASPMASGNTLLLTDTAQVWGVSINVSGTFTGALTTNVWTLHLVWYDGTTNKYIASNDFFASNTASVFNGVIGSGIKTNGNAGQYIFAQITNTTGGTITVTKFRLSAIRIT
jgi:hypothetical protein